MQINVCGSVPIKLYLQKQVNRLIWPKVCSVQIPDLDPEAALLVPEVL